MRGTEYTNVLPEAPPVETDGWYVKPGESGLEVAVLGLDEPPEPAMTFNPTVKERRGGFGFSLVSAPRG